MCFLSKALALALLLTLTTAAPTPEECANLKKTLSAEELHTISGKWILHEAYVLSDVEYIGQSMKETNSSWIEFNPAHNNQTFIAKQGLMVNEMCIRYSNNFTVVGNTFQNAASPQGSTSFLKTCDDCLLMHFSNSAGSSTNLLLLYAKTEKVPQKDQEEVREQAKCLGFQQPPLFTYTQAELCPEQSETTKETEE
ncbi:saxitoxin and tetrodotoxin-binding protein 1-like [Scomber scombrus]|uniref:saxitoxin and tetrodotoxin-binding protein 1-like n=1 Tax=Scomber scombrus TaxID=13677 RepID=UPI002DD819EB|nr:saxitoxin and tetrodotoxin-binding protein 1-like [Scomber scombrus]